MSINNITSSVITALGNQSSMWPLATKDIVNSFGFTYYAGKSGKKVEAQDRFIDEFGTEAIWLFGIPSFKKLIDKTLYVAKKVSPNVDVRTLDKSYQETISDFIPASLKNVTKHAVDNSKKYINMSYAKFGLSTGLTLLAYFGLTKLKHYWTNKQIEENYKLKLQKEQQANQEYMKRFGDTVSFKSLKQNHSNKPSFKGLNKAAKFFMFNPVWNTSLIDAGITTERLATSRNKKELAEYGVKEATLIGFLYFAGHAIQKGINSLSMKLFKTPVALDARFLTSNELKAAQPDKILETVSGFKSVVGNKITKDSALKAVRYVLENQNADNIIVQAAKKSGLVSTVLENSQNLVDTTKFIDGKAIQKLADNIEALVSSANGKGVALSKFAKKVATVKGIGVAANLGICCLALGYAVPKFIYQYLRPALNGGNTDFHVQKETEKRLALAFKNNGIKS